MLLSISVSAGLPNIMGDFASGNDTGFFVASTSTSPFCSGRGVPNYCNAVRGGSPTALNFDASRSSSIYGSSNTVTPLSQSTLWCIRY